MHLPYLLTHLICFFPKHCRSAWISPVHLLSVPVFHFFVHAILLMYTAAFHYHLHMNYFHVNDIT
nr:MAG TPA: hypothetical protein [Caudoviricetes sp.]